MFPKCTCNSIYSIKLGKVAFSGPPYELKENPAKLKQLLLSCKVIVGNDANLFKIFCLVSCQANRYSQN